MVKIAWYRKLVSFIFCLNLCGTPVFCSFHSKLEKKNWMGHVINHFTVEIQRAQTRFDRWGGREGIYASTVPFVLESHVRDCTYWMSWHAKFDYFATFIVSLNLLRMEFCVRVWCVSRRMRYVKCQILNNVPVLIYGTSGQCTVFSMCQKEWPGDGCCALHVVRWH